MDIFKRIKSWSKINKNDLIIAVGFFLAAVMSFGLGRLSILAESQRKEPINIQRRVFQDSDIPGKQIAAKNIETDLKNDMAALLYVGSKNSNKYHLPDCPGALRIKEENKIWFSSKAEAENLGYIQADNCAGF